MQKPFSSDAALGLFSTGDRCQISNSLPVTPLTPTQRGNSSIGRSMRMHCGIWHETYLIQPGRHESINANVPVFGLAAATNHVPVTGRRDTARGRLQPDAG